MVFAYHKSQMCDQHRHLGCDHECSHELQPRWTRRCNHDSNHKFRLRTATTKCDHDRNHELQPRFQPRGRHSWLRSWSQFVVAARGPNSWVQLRLQSLLRLCVRRGCTCSTVFENANQEFNSELDIPKPMFYFYIKNRLKISKLGLRGTPNHPEISKIGIQGPQNLPPKTGIRPWAPLETAQGGQSARCTAHGGRVGPSPWHLCAT